MAGGISPGQIFSMISGVGNTLTSGIDEIQKTRRNQELGALLAKGDLDAASATALKQGNFELGMKLQEMKLARGAAQTVGAGLAGLYPNGTTAPATDVGTAPLAQDTANGGTAPSATRALPTFAQGGPGTGLNTTPFANAISSIESGGRYDILGPRHPKYGHAVGKYQVMESNIPSWTQAAIGRPVSTAEFRSNPAIQEAVFADRFGRLVKQYGSVADAASAWHSGGPLSQRMGAKDSLGTRTPDYVRKFMARLPPAYRGAEAAGALDGVLANARAQLGGAPAPQQAVTTPQTAPVPPTRVAALSGTTMSDAPPVGARVSPQAPTGEQMVNVDGQMVPMSQVPRSGGAGAFERVHGGAAPGQAAPAPTPAAGGPPVPPPRAAGTAAREAGVTREEQNQLFDIMGDQNRPMEEREQARELLRQSFAAQAITAGGPAPAPAAAAPVPTRVASAAPGGMVMPAGTNGATVAPGVNPQRATSPQAVPPGSAVPPPAPAVPPQEAAQIRGAVAAIPAGQNRVSALIRLSATPGIGKAHQEMLQGLLKHELAQTKLTDDQREYLMARGQGFTGTLPQWMDRKRPAEQIKPGEGVIRRDVNGNITTSVPIAAPGRVHSVGENTRLVDDQGNVIYQPPTRGAGGPYPGNSVEAVSLNRLIGQGILTENQAADLATGKTVVLANGQPTFFRGSELIAAPPGTPAGTVVPGAGAATASAAPGAAAPGAAPAPGTAAPAPGATAAPGAPGTPLGPPKSPREISEDEAKNRQLLMIAQQNLPNVLRNFDALSALGNQVGAQAPGRFLTSPQYQVAQDGLRAIVQAGIYSLSGQAAPEGEVKGWMEALMPKPGESAESLAAKKEQLNVWVSAIKMRAYRDGSGPANPPVPTTPTPSAAPQQGQPAPQREYSSEERARAIETLRERERQRQQQGQGQ